MKLTTLLFLLALTTAADQPVAATPPTDSATVNRTAQHEQDCAPSSPELLPVRRPLRSIDQGMWGSEEKLARKREVFAEITRAGGSGIVVLHVNVTADGAVSDHEVRCTTLGPLAIKEAIDALDRFRFPPTPTEGDVQFLFQNPEAVPPDEIR